MHANRQELWKRYEKSDDHDVVDHYLFESLDAARQQRWEEALYKIDSSCSCCKSWVIIRQLEAGQQPPKKNYPLVRANGIAAHLSA